MVEIDFDPADDPTLRGRITLLTQPVSVESAGSRPEILLVDDDATFCATLGALLVVEGFSVFTERTLAGATRYLTTSRPDVLITDLALDDDNGWDVAKYAQQRYPMLPIVVVTGFAGAFADVSADRARLPVFVKPFDPDDLLAYIRAGRSQSA